MKRSVFNMLSGVSLLASAMVAFLWWQSRHNLLAIHTHGGSPYFGCMSESGFIAIAQANFTPQSLVLPDGGNCDIADVGRSPNFVLFVISPPRDGCSRQTGFSFKHFTRSDDPIFFQETFPTVNSFTTITVPHWAIIAILLVPCAFRLRGKPVVVAGLCSNCGYDLRATPERCPECGNKT